MNIKEIVIEYLKAHNLDGLGCEECSCCLPDIMPCDGQSIAVCKAGKKIPCPEDCGCEGFHIQPEAKP